MSPIALVGKRLTRDRLLLLFSGVSAEDVADEIDVILTAQGYDLGQGAPALGVYGRGGKAGRTLWGGFSRRQEFEVNVQECQGLVLVSILGTASALTHGVMVLWRMRKELGRLDECVRARMGDAPAGRALGPAAPGPFQRQMMARQGGTVLLVVRVVLMALIIAILAGLVGLFATSASTR